MHGCSPQRTVRKPQRPAGALGGARIESRPRRLASVLAPATALGMWSAFHAGPS